jgi:hypothetical protein
MQANLLVMPKPIMSWPRTDSHAFQVESCSIHAKKRENMRWSGRFAADFG